MTDREGKLYKPYSGEEGRAFEAQFCEQCKRDQKYWETMDGSDGCQIHTLALCFDPKDPEFPKEWIYQNGKPLCTAFEEK